MTASSSAGDEEGGFGGVKGRVRAGKWREDAVDEGVEGMKDDDCMGAEKEEEDEIDDGVGGKKGSCFVETTNGLG